MKFNDNRIQNSQISATLGLFFQSNFSQEGRLDFNGGYSFNNGKFLNNFLASLWLIKRKQQSKKF